MGGARWEVLGGRCQEGQACGTVARWELLGGSCQGALRGMEAFLVAVVDGKRDAARSRGGVARWARERLALCWPCPVFVPHPTTPREPSKTIKNHQKKQFDPLDPFAGLRALASIALTLVQ